MWAPHCGIRDAEHDPVEHIADVAHVIESDEELDTLAEYKYDTACIASLPLVA